LENTFYSAWITHIPVISAVSAISRGLIETFAHSRVETIDKLIVRDDGTTKFSNTFTLCTFLKNITFEGVIGNSVSFSDSDKLTNASVDSIIDHLKDLTGATEQTLTFHKDVGANMTEEQKAAITAKNWTLVY
jgi:hypothetical protein